MNKDERLVILRRFTQLSLREAENVPVERQIRAFLSLPVHELALRREKVVVLGGRGAGKSALFRLLRQDSAHLHLFFDEAIVDDADWLNGYSIDDKLHPQPAELDALAAAVDNEGLRLYWTLHLLEVLLDAKAGVGAAPKALAPILKPGNQPLAARLAAAAPLVGALARTLDEIDDRLAAAKRSIIVAYDQIDRLGEHNARTRARLAGALLSLWLTLSNRFKNLRAKVFLRHDVFEDAQRTFADASKLRPRSVSLDWDVESLFRVVVRHLANDTQGDATGLEETRSWLVNTVGIELTQNKATGSTPGAIEDELQRAFGIALAGEYMGAGAGKGRTYKWIVNHLQDANGRVVPRSILSLLGYAAERALKNPLRRGPTLLTPVDLTSSLVETSRARVTEVGEEYKVVERLENLRNQSVLMERSRAVSLLAQRRPGEAGDAADDGEFVLDELCRLGVLKIRDDGRIDVPDIYRYGYGIKRKGGAKQAV